MTDIRTNAGLRLWEAQRTQGTGLCVGIDPHVDNIKPWSVEFYRTLGQTRLARSAYGQLYAGLLGQLSYVFQPRSRNSDAVNFLAGLTHHTVQVVETAWKEGVRVFKPQWTFFERIPFVGQTMLAIVCQTIHGLASGSKAMAFVILDRKAGDIDTTQWQSAVAYLSDAGKELVPGLEYPYNFDAMTVTTWMGEDVLRAGLPLLEDGKGLIVVTRTSNPSGTTFQDALVSPAVVDLTGKQEPFRFSDMRALEVQQRLGSVNVTASQLMLHETAMFSQENGLDSGRVSPVFSVIGSTMPEDGSFRRIRGDGAIALVPGFGRQGGSFANIRSLLVKSGPLAGHLGILASSSAMMFAWAEHFGGSGNPDNLQSDLARAIAAFRQQEREFYAGMDINSPF